MQVESGHDGARGVLVEALRELADGDRRRIRRLMELERAVVDAVDRFEEDYLGCKYDVRDECKLLREAEKTIVKLMRAKRVELENEARKRVLNELLNMALR